MSTINELNQAYEKLRVDAKEKLALFQQEEFTLPNQQVQSILQFLKNIAQGNKKYEEALRRLNNKLSADIELKQYAKQLGSTEEEIKIKILIRKLHHSLTDLQRQVIRQSSMLEKNAKPILNTLKSKYQRLVTQLATFKLSTLNKIPKDALFLDSPLKECHGILSLNIEQTQRLVAMLAKTIEQAKPEGEQKLIESYRIAIPALETAQFSLQSAEKTYQNALGSYLRDREEVRDYSNLSNKALDATKADAMRILTMLKQFSKDDFISQREQLQAIHSMPLFKKASVRGDKAYHESQAMIAAKNNEIKQITAAIESILNDHISLNSIQAEQLLTNANQLIQEHLPQSKDKFDKLHQRWNALKLSSHRSQSLKELFKLHHDIQRFTQDAVGFELRLTQEISKKLCQEIQHLSSELSRKKQQLSQEIDKKERYPTIVQALESIHPVNASNQQLLDLPISIFKTKIGNLSQDLSKLSELNQAFQHLKALWDEIDSILESDNMEESLNRLSAERRIEILKKIISSPHGSAQIANLQYSRLNSGSLENIREVLVKIQEPNHKIITNKLALIDFILNHDALHGISMDCLEQPSFVDAFSNFSEDQLELLSSSDEKFKAVVKITLMDNAHLSEEKRKELSSSVIQYNELLAKAINKLSFSDSPYCAFTLLSLRGDPDPIFEKQENHPQHKWRALIVNKLNHKNQELIKLLIKVYSPNLSTLSINARDIRAQNFAQLLSGDSYSHVLPMLEKYSEQEIDALIPQLKAIDTGFEEIDKNRLSQKDTIKIAVTKQKVFSNMFRSKNSNDSTRSLNSRMQASYAIIKENLTQPLAEKIINGIKNAAIFLGFFIGIGLIHGLHRQRSGKTFFYRDEKKELHDASKELCTNIAEYR